MSKNFTKEDVIQQKKTAIKAVNKLLEKYINDFSEKHLKKAYLISYWLSDYARFIDFEEKFIPTQNIAYKRGNIVKLNFGFNIGSEYGGLHYAVVLDNKNEHNSPVVTVIPLTSIKDSKQIHNNNVNLGNEIYRLLKLKYDTISKALQEDANEISNMIDLFDSLLSSAGAALDTCKEDHDENSLSKQLQDTSKYLEKASHVQRIWIEKAEHNMAEQEYLNKIGTEISRMKEGSIALVNQITTISKMRIYDPRNLRGVLAGVSLSEDSMEKINKKLKELYIFEKNLS